MNNESFEYGLTIDNWQQPEPSGQAPDFASAKAQLEKGDYSAIPAIEHWANKELPEAERLLGECALYGKGIEPDLEKAEFFLGEAAKNGEYDAYLGLYEIEKIKGDMKKSKQLLTEGMNKGNLPCTRKLIKIIEKSSEPAEVFLYYEALTKYIAVETDDFEKDNAGAARNQALEKVKDVLKKAAGNPVANEYTPNYEENMDKILKLDIPSGHKETFISALTEYKQLKSSVVKAVKDKETTYKIMKILSFAIPVIISIICYYKIRWGAGFILTFIYWSIPVVVTGTLWGFLGGKSGSALSIGVVSTIPILIVLVIMGAAGVDSFIWVAIFQFITMESQALAYGPFLK